MGVVVVFLLRVVAFVEVLVGDDCALGGVEVGDFGEGRELVSPVVGGRLEDDLRLPLECRRRTSRELHCLG